MRRSARSVAGYRIANCRDGADYSVPSFAFGTAEINAA